MCCSNNGLNTKTFGSSLVIDKEDEMTPLVQTTCVLLYV